MKKIFMIGDFLFHSTEYLSEESMWALKLFFPMIRDAVNDKIEVMFEIRDSESNIFSREHFYKLGGLLNPKYKYNDYDVNSFNENQINYLKKFFNEDTIIIGFELYETMANLLSSFGCKIIDFAIHSYKLFDDMCFAIYTNDLSIYNQLLKYQIPRNKFFYYANYWKIFMENNGMIKDDDLEDNSALFIGQTLIDKSVVSNGKFLNVTDYDEKLKELNKKYSKIYYLPHPALGNKRKFIYDYVLKSPYIELLENRSTYGLLASDKIKKVVGISTSVLYEAQYFNKEVEYLLHPLFNIDALFEEHSYVSILDDYFSPKFWADILAPVCDVNQYAQDLNYFKPSHNKIRNIRNLYWGYAQLDPIQRIPNIERGIKNIYRKLLYKF